MLSRPPTRPGPLKPAGGRAFRPAAASVIFPSATLALLLSTGAHAAPQHFKVKQADGRPAAMAVVAVAVRGAPLHAPAGTVADMTQQNRQFVPPVVAIQTGSAVRFPNFDTVRHHVYSFSPTRKFEIKLYIGTPSTPVVFDKPGTATLGCNIHDTMIGYIHVVDTPYFGTTDAAGRVVLDIPPGDHTVRVWHPAMGETHAPVQIAWRPAAGTPLEVTLPR